MVIIINFQVPFCESGLLKPVIFFGGIKVRERIFKASSFVLVGFLGVAQSSHLRNNFEKAPRFLLERIEQKQGLAEQIAMADWGGFLSKSSGFGGRSMVDEDFDEEDVWGLVKEKGDSSTKVRVSKEISGSSSAWRLPATPRTIPRANTQTSHEAQVVQRSSAPQEIPDWSKIYGRNAKKFSVDGESNGDAFGYGYRGDYYNGNFDDGHDDEDDGDDMVPPHEWIARKLARSQISSFSVCEGIGRTLKGRDLSKVRNAVLTKTGFIE